MAVEALASFPVTEPEQGHPYLKALTTFRRANSSQSFEATVENLEATLQALVVHSDRVTPERRDTVQDFAAKLASYLLTPSGPSADHTAVDIFINRHPIYQSQVDVFAYELQTQQKTVNGASQGYLAVTRTILDKFTERGLDQFVGHLMAFITVPHGAVKAGHCDALPKHRSILKVQDTGDPDKDLFLALTRLSNKGHRIAIADSLIRKSDHPLLPIANIVKLDLSDLGRQAVEARLQSLTSTNSKLLANNVETHADFEFARDLGFDYFQGYFFCKPQITGDEIPSNRVAMTRLLAKLRDPLLDIQQLATIISQDVALSYKMLRFANSAYVGLPVEVDSIHRCVNLVGIERIRNWASLLLLSKIEDTPRELMITAVIRARLCESLAEATGRGPHTAFTVGLFSVLDALLNCGMIQALDLMPLTDEIRDALVYHKGPFGETLACVLAYERSDWNSVTLDNLSAMQIRDAYVDSLGWARSHSDGLGI